LPGQGKDKMRNGQFTNEQIVALLQEAEKGERSITVFCREKGITETTYYRWRHRFGGLGARDVQRLRDLEKENARLKRLLAESELDKAILKEAASGNF
jgi:putative transposase